MDNRPIGVFDSGLGGLTAVKELRELMPHESIVYFGDTGRVPYGTKSKETILKYSLEDIDFLRKKNVKAVVAACGTASSMLNAAGMTSFDFPFTGVLRPTAEAALRSSKNHRIGIIGTSATVKSSAYEIIMQSLSPEVKVISRACPLFVPLVENGYFGNNNKISRLVAQEYITPFIADKIDTLILGCTHYPLLRDVIAEILTDSVTLIDSGKETAIFVRDMLCKKDMLCDETAVPVSSYFVSDSTEQFSVLAERFLQKKVDGSVTKAFAG